MESSYEIVIKKAKAIESILKNKFSAPGRGLGERIRSIEYSLPAALVKDIKKIANIRNRVAHEDGFILDDVQKFITMCDKAVTKLNDLDSFKPDLEPEFKVRSCVKFTVKNRLKPYVVRISIFAAIYVFSMSALIGFFPMLVISLIIFILLFKTIKGVKSLLSDLSANWSFYKDRCEYESNGETQTINYNIIKSVRMGDLNEVSIMTVDRGVEETHGIFLVNETSLSAKDVCKKIHELVFR